MRVRGIGVSAVVAIVRHALADSTVPKPDVVNVNVPTCTTGSIRDTKQVPVAFVIGFVSVSELDANNKPVTPTTALGG